jgi:hypothetical protein
MAIRIDLCNLTCKAKKIWKPPLDEYDNAFKQDTPANSMRSAVLIVFSFLLVSLTPLMDVAKADNSSSSAVEVTDGYDDYWWVCYDDDCSEGQGVDQLDYYKIKVYDGDEVKWEIYNRADPHYVWLGVMFWDTDGSVINLPADECSTCSDDDMMWVGDYETDSTTITYRNVASSGGYAYMRVHAADGTGGDGTWYDIRVDVDTSGRTGSSGNDNSDSGNSGGSCTSASSCPYQSGKTATCYSGACIYFDNPDYTPGRVDTSSSDVEVPGKLLAYAIILPILFVIGVISRTRKGRSRGSQNIDLTTSFEPTTPNYDFDEYTVPSQTMYSSYNQNTIPLAQSINSYNPIPIQPNEGLTSAEQSYPNHNTVPLEQSINSYNPIPIQPNEGLTSAEQSYPNQNIRTPGPPPAVPSKPRNSLTGEFDDDGYEWLKWNANGLWYWRSGDYAEWTEFNQ